MLALVAGFFPACTFGSESMVQIGGGSFPSFLKQKETKDVTVPAFRLDSEPITNEQFLRFLEENPNWRRSKIKKIFSDSHYLQTWRSDLDFGSLDRRSPVTFVSWFAADAFCRSQGRSLPTTDQWEFAAYDQGRNRKEITADILSWYSRPNELKLSRIGKRPPNGYGVRDLFGLVWEWTLDFSSALGTDDDRNGSGDTGLFCGAAGQVAADPSDYATFMRYEFRSSLRANYSTGNLGFRCAKERVIN